MYIRALQVNDNATCDIFVSRSINRNGHNRLQAVHIEQWRVIIASH